MYEETFVCAHCGLEFDIDQLHETDDGDLCDDCYNVDDTIEDEQLFLD